MSRALDRAVVELALAERPAVVGADVVDRSPLAVLGQAEAQRLAVDLDDADRARLDVAEACDGGEPRCLLEGGHAASSSSMPMRAASAARTCSRIVSSPIWRTTCSKKPRTIIRSAAVGSRPRVWA